MPAITGIHHLSLTVRDAAASEEFYTKVFGFVRVLELPDIEARGSKLVLADPATGTIVGLSVHRTNDGAAFSEFRTGLDHVAFGVAKSDLEDWVARLDELGIEHSEVRDTGVGHLVTFRDPDNVQIELWATPEA